MRTLLLGLPVRMQKFTQHVDITLFQTFPGLETDIFYLMQVVDHRRVILFALVVLLFKYLRGTALLAGKEKQQVAFQFLQYVFIEVERFD